MSLDIASERLCYVYCNFCNNIVPFSVPCTTATVRCWNCANLLSVNMGLQTHLPQNLQLQEEQSSFEDVTKDRGSSSTCNKFDILESAVLPRLPPIRPLEKRQSVPSAYNQLIKEQIQRIKASNPGISHREAFSTAAKNDIERQYKQDPPRFWSIRERLTSSIKDKLSKLPPSSSTRCIYKVPEKLRKVNEEAFTPQLVSIGPYHHGKPHLKTMEEYKLRCLRSFMDRIGNAMSIFDYIVTQESDIRCYYQDDIELSSEEFSEINLLDSVFIVELFLKNSFPDLRENDEIFDKLWMRSDILRDLLLIENQLPLFVPEMVYQKCFSDSNGSFGGKFFRDVVYDYFKSVGNTQCFGEHNPRHLVEYLQMVHIPSDIGSSSTPKGKFEYTRSATELREAGVNFSTETGTSSFKITFRDKEGVLEITKLKVDEWTETFFRNMIAFEQCEHMSTRYISDYIILMDSLINTAMDVDLLVQDKIIDNKLGDSEQVANIFNNLYKQTITEDSNFYFADTCSRLNKYSRDPWHQWKATQYRWKVILKRDYFSSPWTASSVIAAVILLALTITQTVCAFKGLCL